MADSGQAVIPRSEGFAPVLPQRARVLILGTLPSVASLARQQYYGHPRNAFWPIMAEMLGFEPTLSYEKRVQHLRRRGIALWDVCQSAQRVGSLDAAIEQRGMVANDIAALLSTQPSIGAVFLNGVAAAKLFQKWVAPALAPTSQSIPLITLPSTSPANAALTLAQKHRAWAEIGRYLT